MSTTVFKGTAPFSMLAAATALCAAVHGAETTALESARDLPVAAEAVISAFPSQRAMPNQTDAERMGAEMMNPGNTLTCMDQARGGEFRVLVYGNSIARHTPWPKIGWTNDWGMAASAPEKDFAHLVAAGLEDRLGKKGDLRVRNMAPLERSFTNDTSRMMAAERSADVAWAPDYVVIAVGENSPVVTDANSHLYVKFLADLARPFATLPKRPKIVMRSPFFYNKRKAELTERAAKEVGAVYVDVGELGKKDENKAIGLFWHKGVANHPGDLGMKRLADLILAGFDAIGLPTVERIVASREWRPLDMGDHKCVYFKSERIPELEIKPGTALDLSQYLPRNDIDACGRIVADSNARFVFENAPSKSVRLRGFNCTYGGSFDHFHEATKDEISDIAEQIRMMGLDVVRLHFFDAKFAGRSGMKFFPFRNTDIADTDLPQTAEAIAAAADRDFLDRFHWFVKCLRDRGVYLMFDIVTSRGLMTKAGQAKGYPRFQMFMEEKYRNHWKAVYGFWMNTVNPYTGKRFLDDPQVLGITFFNEQEHLFGEKTEKLKDFTPAFRAEFGADMPEFSLALLRGEGTAADNARSFLRTRIDEMNSFYMGVVKESGFKGFVTNWDMFMRNLEGAARRDYPAVSMHTYHAHPQMSVPLPEGITNAMAMTPWMRGKCQTSWCGSSIGLKSYLARAAATRVLGRPFMLTEYSHCGGNRYAQEAPVVQSAIAALQDWQALMPHSDLVKLWRYGPFLPGAFDSGDNLMARVASMVTAFGWQRGDIKSAPHAVSFHVPEKELSSKSYLGAIGSAYNSLHFLTRIGSDYVNAHNPIADLYIVAESYVGATSMGMWATLSEEERLND